MTTTPIHLTERVRDNLSSLRDTQANVDKTNGRVNTGLKVASANDDPVAYFRSKSLYDRSETFDGRKSDISQGIDTIKTIQTGLDASTDMIKKMKAYVNGMQGSDSKEEYNAFHDSFKEFAKQFNDTIADDKYGGASYLNNTAAKSVIRFSTDAARKLTLQGTDIRAANTSMAIINGDGSAELADWTDLKASKLDIALDTQKSTNNALGLLNATHVAWEATAGGVFDNTGATGTQVGGIDALEASKDVLDAAAAHISSLSVTFQANMSILQSRKDFTEDYVDDLNNGADDLVLADTEQEGANLMSLNVQQKLGYNSLSTAGKQGENILTLVRS